MPATAQISIAIVGIDIGKNSFHIVALDDRGAIVLRQRWSRNQVEGRFANMPPCLIGMEACVGAHHLSRKLKALGHDARLMPAKYVRPYSKGQKNDFRDAEAIAEAVQRPTMKFVSTKTAEQLDLQALHRVRERLVSQRTGIINQIRAFLLERGIAVRQGQRFLRAELPHILAMPTDVLSPRMVRTIEDLSGDWHRLDERIAGLSNEIEAIARQNVGCERLMSVPGVGPIVSSAIVAAIGAGEAFSKGRDFAAWLGLVPSARAIFFAVFFEGRLTRKLLSRAAHSRCESATSETRIMRLGRTRIMRLGPTRIMRLGQAHLSARWGNDWRSKKAVFRSITQLCARSEPEPHSAAHRFAATSGVVSAEP
jgi:transposase